MLKSGNWETLVHIRRFPGAPIRWIGALFQLSAFQVSAFSAHDLRRTARPERVQLFAGRLFSRGARAPRPPAWGSARSRCATATVSTARSGSTPPGARPACAPSWAWSSRWRTSSVVPLLVANRDGYRALCRLITTAKLRAPKGESRVQWQELAEASAGLLALTGDEEGPVSRGMAERRGGRR